MGFTVIITENEEFSGSTVNFRMSRALMLELAVEVLEATTFDIHIRSAFIDIKMKREINFV